jgi:acylphosphatase
VTPEDQVSRAVCIVGGRVQAVGFRWWASQQAERLGLAGHAVNLRTGAVEIVVQGPRTDVDTFVDLLRERPSTSGRPGRVASVDVSYDVADPSVTRFSAG